jgi:hypothetical protein
MNVRKYVSAEVRSALAFAEKQNSYGVWGNSSQRRFSVRADTAVRPYAEDVDSVNR